MRASVITPTFNSRPYIEACIENVAAQGAVVIEHIIVDGGSTDGTIDIINRLINKYSHLSLVPGPDKGQSDAINKGTALATGSIIGVLNSDDTYEPNTVHRAVSLIKTMPQPAFVTGNCLIAYGGGKAKMNRPRDLRIESLLLGPDLASFPANPASYFYSKKLHDLVGGFDINDHYAMDYEFILKCAIKTRLHYIDEHWGNFYLHPGCKTFDDTHAAERQNAIIAKYQRFLDPEQIRRQSRIRNIKKLKAVARKTRDWLVRSIEIKRSAVDTRPI